MLARINERILALKGYDLADSLPDIDTDSQTPGNKMWLNPWAADQDFVDWSWRQSWATTYNQLKQHERANKIRRIFVSVKPHQPILKNCRLRRKDRPQSDPSQASSATREVHDTQSNTDGIQHYHTHPL